MRRAIGIVALSMIAACGPMGAPFGGGGASSSFSSIPPASGSNGAAQALLFGAWLAVTATSMGGDFSDVTPATVRAFDPTTKVIGDAPARVGVISLNHAGPDGVVFSTKSGSGDVFCLTVTADGTPHTGSVDAHDATSVDGCTGKAWVPAPP